MKLPVDKVLHLSVGLVIYLSVGIVNPAVALGAVIVAGVGKEIYDYYDYGKFDPWDVVATIAVPAVLYGLDIV